MMFATLRVPALAAATFLALVGCATPTPTSMSFAPGQLFIETSTVQSA